MDSDRQTCKDLGRHAYPILPQDLKPGQSTRCERCDAMSTRQERDGFFLTYTRMAQR